MLERVLFVRVAGPFAIALLSRAVACCWDIGLILAYLLTKPGCSLPPASILISEEQVAARLTSSCNFPQVGHPGCSLSALFCLRFVAPPKTAADSVRPAAQPRKSRICLSVSPVFLCNPLTGAIQRSSAGHRRVSNWQPFRARFFLYLAPPNETPSAIRCFNRDPILSCPTRNIIHYAKGQRR